MARAGSGKTMGRVGGKALLLFQVSASLSLVFGIAAAVLFQPGAGLTPRIQFGEYCWWYFSANGSMAFYDDRSTFFSCGSVSRDDLVTRLKIGCNTSAVISILRFHHNG